MGSNLYLHEKQITDMITGEIVSEERTSLKKQNKEEYVRLFLHSVSVIAGANLTAAQHNVLLHLLNYTINNSNLLFMHKSIHEEIANQLNIEYETVRKAISKLVKEDLIVREKRMYFLNPAHFGRGDWKELKKLRKNLSIEYDFETQEIKRIEETQTFYSTDEELKNDINTLKVAKFDIKFDEKNHLLTKQIELVNDEKTEIIDIIDVVDANKKEEALKKLREFAKSNPLKEAALSAKSSFQIREAGETEETEK